MFGISLAFIAGYFVARWFGDFINKTLDAAWHELQDWR